jgi:hypothetical protein
MKTVKTLMLFSTLCFGSYHLNAQKTPLTTKQFLDLKIHIISLNSNLDILKITGYDSTNQLVTNNVKLERNKGLGVWTPSFMPTLSIVTVPFKVRPRIDNMAQNVVTGLKNAGMNIGLFNYKLDRYFVNEKYSSHNFSAGILIAPSAEELSPENTNNSVLQESTQLFISTGISLTYTYNDISITAIPAGLDFATTPDGGKFVYNKKYWWGFGLGISLKLLGVK